jgi:hypothetical protein
MLVLFGVRRFGRAEPTGNLGFQFRGAEVRMLPPHKIDFTTLSPFLSRRH